MGLEETISERLQAGFLSDSREGRVQAYFAWYNANKDYEHFDGQEAQRREMEAGVTQADWNAYHRSFEAQF